MSQQNASFSRKGITTRREFLARTIPAGIAIAGLDARGIWNSCWATPTRMAAEAGSLRDRAMGVWFGAAAGDALGGPVEAQHYKRILRQVGEIKNFLPYGSPISLIPGPTPGWALHPEPGSITDDTYIRRDLTRYYLETEAPRSPAQLAQWMLEHAELDNWWVRAVEVLRRIERGELEPETAGNHHQPGGGGAWWHPTGILNAGNPEAASAEAKNLCRIWKAPLEQDILGGVCAGTAESLRPKATVDSIIGAVLDYSGPLARKLFERGAEIGRKAQDRYEVIHELYANALVNSVTTESDGPMPEHQDPVEYTDDFYLSALFAEQQPWALAYFAYGKGDFLETVRAAAQGGRDADSIASNSAGWVGGLVGESGIPADWVTQLVEANLVDFNLRELGEQLVDRIT